MNTYLISDHHFGHTNIIKYTSRHFKDKWAMDEAMIENWNDTVEENSLVYYLGDFSFYSQDKTKEIFDRLHGNKHLILGNHDRHHADYWWKTVGFQNVYDKPIILYDFLILSHEPMYLQTTTAFVNFHGHTHNNWYEALSDSKVYFNVSAELLLYRPICLDNLLPMLKERYATFKIKRS